MKQQNYAVLTGDIVQSGKLEKGKLAEIQAFLKSAHSQLQELSENAVVGSLGITRGDGWQLALSRPDRALRSALFLRASLKAEFSVDTRVCIGVGRVERLVVSNIVESTGTAFELSGRGLDCLPEELYMELQTDPLDKGLQRMVRLMDCVVQGWSSTDSRAVAGYLLGKTQEEIAAEGPLNPKTGKPVSRQSISKALFRAHWDTVTECVTYVENTICKL
ncbi:hypothetical protein P0Y35_03390 [Kiritimatiellaeota bacterium B1221]|nr:hypothetical protein [Kiritimatiellaeota bacterium B1221]